MRYAAVPATLFIAALLLLMPVQTSAAASIKTGEVIATQTAAVIDTATLKAGDTISLNVVEPYPQGAAALAGATITLSVTSVTHAGANGRARVAFLFSQITFQNGHAEHIAAYILSSKVVRRGEANSSGETASAPAQPPSLTQPGMAPSSTIFWKKNIGVSNSVSASTGGYAYASSGDVRLPAGSLVKIELARDLSLPGNTLQ